jgi:RNA polymerase sigma-70 factor (ECF subfamily)
MPTAEAADDQALVAAAQAGDGNALDTLLRRHYDRVYAICRRIAGSRRDADDAAQEAMISIVRGLARFDGRAAFSTWTYRIATNAALDELRKRDRRPAPHLDTEGGSTREVTDPMSQRRIDGIVDRLAIDEALDELPEEFRLAVVLRDLCDLDYAEIAKSLDVPVGTVKSRIARGRSLLASRLGNRDPAVERPNATHPREATGDG